MFSQSCNYLPNKKQSLFGNQSSQNMGLFSGFTRRSCQDSAGQTNVEFSHTKGSINNLGSRTNIGIMDLFFSFTENPRFEFGKRYFPTLPEFSEKSKLNSKELLGLTNGNSMTSPIVQSYLVGGFVGSKSQLGRRSKKNIGKLHLWDMIRDLVSLVSSSPCNPSQRPKSEPSSHLDKNCDVTLEVNSKEQSSDKCDLIGFSDFEEPLIMTKQTYADVAKRSKKDLSPQGTVIPKDQLSVSCDNWCDIKLPAMEPSSSCNKSEFTTRDRITSECSADSEDSYIVFECSEEDMDKDIYSSDDDTLSAAEEVSLSDSGIVPSNNSSFCGKLPSKKVCFADEKNLVKIHPMVTWDYAYRMARRGPWEMMARDSERFKLRIARTEAVLKPILDPEHRSAVYRDRFSKLER